MEVGHYLHQAGIHCPLYTRSYLFNYYAIVTNYLSNMVIDNSLPNVGVQIDRQYNRRFG